jgi:hypothetical protein
MTVKAMKSPEAYRLPWPKGSDWSGPRPFLSISDHAEFMEQAKSDTPLMIPEGRAGLSGRLGAPNEEDRYRVAVKPNTKVRLEVFAERIGSPIDGALVVRNEKGDQLARTEDSPGTLDPALEYTVPDKVTAIVVGVVDAQGRGGPRGIYRLVIEPQGVSKDSFKLTTTTQQLSLPRGGFGVVPVVVDRRGCVGPINLLVEPQLRGLDVRGAMIPDGADGALVSFRRLDSGTEPIVMTMRGRSDAGVEKSVFVKNHPMERLQPWLAMEVALGTTEQTAKDFAIDWRDWKSDAYLVPASRFLLPVKLTRPDTKTTVKLTLLTSQNTPLVNNQPDPNKALRQDKLGELAAKVDTGDVTILVPPDLSATSYDVTVQAELLDAAKKPIAVAFAPVKRLPVVIPIAVMFDGPNRIEAAADPKKGTTARIFGKVERREGVKADIAIALTGLPAGAKAEAVTVKGDATTFTLNVNFPPNVPPGDIKAKLSGSYAPDAKQPNVRVRSREVDCTIVLQAPPK